MRHSIPSLRRNGAPRMLAAAAVLLIAVTGGCAPSTAGTVASPGQGGRTGEAALPEGAMFDYQLGGAYALPKGTAIVVRDRGAEPAAGAYSICYINGFQTQPGEAGEWPADALLRQDGAPVIDENWPDEFILDTSTAEKRSVIVERVAPWIRACAADGYQGVEFDNLDSFSRSRGALTFEDNLALAADLVREAHTVGLTAGQKNSGAFAAELRARAGFDFAVAEECAAFSECGDYTRVYGRAVIDVEYADALPRSFTEMCADPESPSSMILRDRGLAVAGDPAYVFETCPADTARTLWPIAGAQ